MKVSIVVSSFNEQADLPRLLVSIISQSYTDVETIIVEGSNNSEIEKIAAQYGAVFVRDTKANIGYSRNLGATVASGDLLFFTNADCTMDDKQLLSKVVAKFKSSPKLVSCGGITKEICTSEVTQLIYNTQHVLRHIFSLLPYPAKRYRPTANFIVVRSSDFKKIGGFPEVFVNEDGAFGAELERYAWKKRLRLEYALELRVTHPTRRFDRLGPFGGLGHYLYVIPNFTYLQTGQMPIFGRILNSLARYGERNFRNRKGEEKKR